MSFSGKNKGQESSDSNLNVKNTGIKPLNRAELKEETARLSENVRQFWTKKYTLEEIPEAIARLNENLPKGEKIKDRQSYYKSRKKDPRLPPFYSLQRQYKKEFGTGKGIIKYILTGKEPEPKPKYYTLEEIPEAIARLNENLPKGEKIKDRQSYYKSRKKDPRLPPFYSLQRQYKKEFGTGKGIIKYILTGKEPEPKPKYYTLKEIPEAIARLNENLPEEKKIKDRQSYYEFYKQDPRLPFFSSLQRQYKKEFGTGKGFAEYIFRGKEPEPKPKYYTLKEIPEAIARLNENLPKGEKIKDRQSYYKSRKKDPRLPPFYSLQRQYKKRIWNWKRNY